MAEIFYNAMVLREPYSGVEVTVHELACALARYGTLPVRVCLPADHRPVPEAPHVRLEELNPEIAHSRMRRVVWEQTALPALLRRAKAPLLHAPAYVAPLFAPCPTVVTVHDLHVMTHPQFCRRSNRLHYRLLIPASLRKAAAVVVFSEYTRQVVAERFPAVSGKVTVIPPGLSPNLVRCGDAARLQEVRARYDLPGTFLLFVGDLTSRKNITGLVNAFMLVQAERPDLHLVLAGAADPACAAEVDGIIRARGLGHRARRVGYVASEDLPVLYSLAAAFVFPSHDEGFGLPPLEAMACGCPVVCSGGAAVKNCGDAAVSCDPRDSASIAAAVSLLLDDPDFRRRKTEAGYRKAAGFSWERAARATEGVYRAVLGEKPKVGFG